MAITKVNYLNNKDLLKEIHLSKCTYSSFLLESDKDYDHIVKSVEDIDAEAINTAKSNRIKKIYKESKEKISVDSIDESSLVFRIMTCDHIPLAPGRKKTVKTTADKHEKVNFPPFQHFRNIDGTYTCVGKSHWCGGLENGWFSTNHGSFTRTLSNMTMKLVDRYGTKGNWRGYCVDEETYALTKRGWISGNKLTTSDKILSFNEGHMTWSKIKSIYRDKKYSGQMYELKSDSIDALVTHGHKFVTSNGIQSVENLNNDDSIIVMGKDMKDSYHGGLSSNFVNLIATLIKFSTRVDPVGYTSNLFTNGKFIEVKIRHGKECDKFLSLLEENHMSFKKKSFGKNKSMIIFDLISTCKIRKMFNYNTLEYHYVNIMTSDQRSSFIDILFDTSTSIVHFSKSMLNSIQHIMVLCGYPSIITHVDKVKKYNKGGAYSLTIIDNPPDRMISVSSINEYKKSGNIPTIEYTGLVWCPETEYGSFVCKRNDKIFITGNSYNDEMKAQALIHLFNFGLQFDESKGNNPFAYLTKIMSNSFVRVLNNERKHQKIRDDLLEQHGLNPSFTRQNSWHSDE